MPIVAAAVIGAGASIYAGNKASKAAEAAGRQQQQATAAAQAGVTNATQQATARLQPYSTEGTAARRGYNALLGLPTATTGAPGTSAGGGKDWAGYWGQVGPTTQNNPTSPWHRVAAQTDGSPEALGKAYYEWSNGSQGAPGELPGEQQVSTPQDIAADRTAAYDAFNASPYAVAAQTGADKAQSVIMGNAGANSRVLSGRTANLTQQNATAYKQNALLSYMDQLNGVGQRGYEADTNIGNAAIGAAQTVGNYGVNGAAQQGNALMTAGQAQSDGMTNAALIVGNALGNYGAGKTTNTNKTAPGSYYGTRPATGANPLTMGGGAWRTPPFLPGG